MAFLGCRDRQRRRVTVLEGRVPSLETLMQTLMLETLML
jgi:hypothetical protein